MSFYHGTSTSFGLGVNDYLHPAIKTGVLREEWRKKHIDKVFFTDSVMSATKFAKKAAQKYGGEPVVFIVQPKSYYYHINTNEYICDKAQIIGLYRK